MSITSLNETGVIANKGMLEFLNDQAIKQFNTGGPQVFDRSRVAPLSDLSTQAINRTRDIAMSGNPNLPGANEMIGGLLGGAHLRAGPSFDNLSAMANGSQVGASNPYMNQMEETLRRDISDRIASQFGASGRTGGAYNVQSMARGLGDAIGGIRANQYNQDVSNQLTASSLMSRDFDAAANRQLTAAGYLPALDRLRYSGLPEMAAAGGALDTQNQRQLTDEALRFDANQNRGQNNLAFLSQVAGGAVPGVQAAPTPSTGNQLLTGGLTGATLGSALTGGSGLGTLAGGLFGLGSVFF